MLPVAQIRDIVMSKSDTAQCRHRDEDQQVSNGEEEVGGAGVAHENDRGNVPGNGYSSLSESAL